MAYTLKTTGIAVNLITCVAVDEDGTIKDFKGNAITLGTGVAASVATGSWKSTARQYFETFANGTFGFFGVTFNATQPTVDEADADGCSVFVAAHGASANTSDVPMAVIAGSDGAFRGPRRLASTGKFGYNSGGTTAQTTTSVPTDGTTKFGVGVTYRSGVSSTALYGLESGSMSSEATSGSDGGFGTSYQQFTVGGSTGQGNAPAKLYLVAVFNKILSTAEMQSLHGDGTDTWITTLFEASGGSPPVLSGAAPSGTIDNATIATIRATTDQESGTFYAVIGTGSQLTGVTAAQIKAGQQASGSAALASSNSAVSNTSPSTGVGGLTASVTYTYAAIQNNAGGDSNIVTGSFTTAAYDPIPVTSIFPLGLYE